MGWITQSTMSAHGCLAWVINTVHYRIEPICRVPPTLRFVGGRKKNWCRPWSAVGRGNATCEGHARKRTTCLWWTHGRPHACALSTTPTVRQHVIQARPFPEVRLEVITCVTGIWFTTEAASGALINLWAVIWNRPGSFLERVKHSERASNVWRPFHCTNVFRALWRKSFKKLKLNREQMKMKINRQ